MKIIKTQDGGKITLNIEGRLDTNTAPQLEAEVKACIDNVTELCFNFEKLEYVSSAGLRVLLATQKQMNSKGEFVITNVCEDIMEVFEITGFSDILTIK